MKNLGLTLFLKALCVILCQFCDCCKNEEECPDGVCDPLLKTVDDLDAQTGAPMSLSPQAPDFNIDWSQLQGVVDAASAFVTALMSFLGLKRTVG